MRRRTLLAGTAALARGNTVWRDRPSRRAASAKVLRFVPQANLANPDPVWTTATVAINHGYMVWDTLYGIDDALIGQPQMVAGHEVSGDELTWTFTLRDGLKFPTVSRCARSTAPPRSRAGRPRTRSASSSAAQTDEMKAAGRQALPDPPEEAVPPDDLCAGRAELLHHARTHGQDTGERADQGISSAAARSSSSATNGCRAPARRTRRTPATCRGRSSRNIIPAARW